MEKYNDFASATHEDMTKMNKEFEQNVSVLESVEEKPKQTLPRTINSPTQIKPIKKIKGIDANTFLWYVLLKKYLFY